MGVQIQGDTGNVIATKGTYSGNVTIGGTLTYEDVTNIDSVGLVTAREGIEVGARPGVAASISVDGNAIFSGITTIGSKEVGAGITLSPDGDVFATGVCTATSFSGDGSSLTGIDADKISEGNTEAEVVDTGSDGHFKVTTEGTERIRVGPSGQIGIAGANYGTSGQVITSQGSGSVVQWAAPTIYTEYSTQTVGGTDSYSITITGDPKVIDVSLYEVRHVASQNIMYRLSNSSSETSSGYYDIGSVWRHDHNSNSTSRGINQGQGCLVNYNFNGVNNLITGKAVFTRVNTGLYTFSGSYDHYFHANESSTTQYNLLTNGHVNNTSAVTQIRIFTSGGGNFTSGTINVRGIA